MLGSFDGLFVLSFTAALITVDAATTQREVNYVAQHLKVDVYLQTNHESGLTYDVTYRLANTRRTHILANDDWRIEFCLKGRELLTKPDFKENGLQVKAGTGCTYYIQPIPGSNTFSGLSPGASESITINLHGLSAFRNDIFPGFYFKAGSLDPVVIASTSTEDLNSFVHLAPANSSEFDFSTLSPVRRLATTPRSFDLNRVPLSIVIPATKYIDVDMRNPNVLDLAQPPRWYVWPDTSVSSEFNKTFLEKLTKLPGITLDKFHFVNSMPPNNTDKIFLQIRARPGQTKDAYTMAVMPVKQNVLTNTIHISAPSSEGLQNALETILGVAGLFTNIPELTIQDDARFPVRSVMLDVTKNFVPKETVIKLLGIMKRYKLNNLVLKLADDHAWRVEMPRYMDFDELFQFASQRCHNESACLPPAFGADSQSGYYTQGDFVEIIQAGKDMDIYVTPMVNVLGGIRSAKKASHLRYLRLLVGNVTEAERLHLNSTSPAIPNAKALKNILYTDGLLDPCSDATIEFIKDVLLYFNKFYRGEMREFHLGGDELTKFNSEFQTCKSQGIAGAAATRKMLQEIQLAANTFNTKLRVNQDAMIDQDTKRCIDPYGQFVKYNITVDFWDISPGNQELWGLSDAEKKYINDPVPFVEEGQPEDPLLGFLDKQNSSFNKNAWSKKGIAPWARAYDCANSGYKVILGPEAYFSLDSAYELDFDERGNRKYDRFHIINLHRMMMFEPLNLHTNMDTGYDGYRYLPYRLCHMYECTELIQKRNIVGLQATIDTENIRTENALWESILPELLLFAEKAWREAPFENILRAEKPQTLTNETANGMRRYYLDAEITNFTNTWGYKESGICDFHNYTYRVPRPGARVDFTLPRGGLPPYNVLAVTDMPGADIEYRELHRPNSQWRLLFPRDGRTAGGYNMTFPESSQSIEMRTRSTDGLRRSLPIVIRGGTKDVWPKEVPITYRRGACLPIYNASFDDFDKITVQQWHTVLSNVPVASRWEEMVQYYRNGNLSVIADVVGPRTMQIAYAEMEQLQENTTALPSTDPRRQIYEVERRFSQMRRDRVDEMELEYQQCQGGGGGGQGAQGQGLGQGRGQGRGQSQGQMRGRQMRGQSQGQMRGQGRSQGQGQSSRNAQGQSSRSAQGRRTGSARAQGR